MNGIFAPDAPIPFGCASGNCNWPQFQSLGVCSSCTNVTANTNQSCYAMQPEAGGFYVCAYTTPSGLTTNLSTSATSLESENTFAMDAVAGSAKEPAVLLKFAAINMTNTSASNLNSNLYQNPGWWEATECVLSWCAKTYRNTSVVNGTLNLEPSSAIQLTPANVQSSNNAGIREFVVPQNETSFSGNRSFHLNLTSSGYLVDYLLTMFYTYPDVSSTCNLGIINIGNALYEAGNLTNSFAKLATSLTNGIRTTRNSTSILGQTITLEPYIHVHWA